MISRRKQSTKKHSRRRNPLDFTRLEPRKLLSANAPDLAPEIESAIRTHLSITPDTAHLQTGQNELQVVEVQSKLGDTTVTLQQTLQGIPVHGSTLDVTVGSAGQVETITNNTFENLRTRRWIGPNLAASNAEQAAQRESDASFENTLSKSQLVWQTVGNSARLSWQVSTFINDAYLQNQAPQYSTIVDAHSGLVILQQKTDSMVDHGDVFPRIVINDTIGPAGSRTYAEPFDAVAAWEFGCTGTLIAPDVIISARHCGIGGGDEWWFGDDSANPDYTAVTASTFNPAGGGTLLDGGDVTIVRLTADVPSNIATPMRLIDATDELVGDVIATIGYGWNGVGSTGHGGTADDFRWGGENILDAYGVPSSNSGSNILSTDFDDGSAGANTIAGSDPNPLQFEATTAPGDSGGPILVERDGEWLISGVLSGGTSPTSVYGDISWWTGTAIFRTEIEAEGGIFVGGGRGSVELDKANYNVDDTLNFFVRDPNVVAPVMVTLTSDSGDTETVTLTDVGNFRFDGTINTSGDPVSSEDGTLQVALGDEIVITYEDVDDGTGGSGTRTDTATVASFTEYVATDVPVSILDNQKVISELEITDLGSVNDINVNLNITHTWDSDLSVNLISPAGTVVNLFDGVGGDGDNFIDTNLDDEGDTPIASGGAPFTGVFIPAQPLSNFDGESITGTWTLSVSDTASGDQGTLTAWSLLIDSISPEIGFVSLDRDAYNEGETIAITVTDANATTPVMVDVASSTGDMETITLAGSNGIYTGTIDIVLTGGSGDGQITANAADTITVTYEDADNGAGGSQTATDTAVVTNVVHYASANVPVDILDNQTVTSTIEITDPGTIRDINVELDITHTWDADLDVSLVGPDGTIVSLFNGVGDDGDDFVGTILDDEATQSITAGSAPFTGSFRPEGDLSIFDDLEFVGTWTLEITDNAGGDEGQLTHWCVYIDVIPEPAAEPDISIASVSGTYTELDSAEFVVTLSQAATGDVMIDYTTTTAGFANPATPGQDFTPSSGTLTFAAGETSKTISVPVLADVFAEADEQFGIELSNPVNGVLVTSNADVVLEDDDVFSLGVPIDFGTLASPVDSASIGFTDTLYDPTLGMGWENQVNFNLVERNRGNDLTIDQAFLRSADFVIDIPNGTYQVTGIFGIIQRVDPFIFNVENVNNTLRLRQGPNVQVPVIAEVTDGQLNIFISGGGGLDLTTRLSGVKVEEVSGRSLGDSPSTPSDFENYRWETRGEFTDSTSLATGSQAESPRIDNLQGLKSDKANKNRLEPVELNDWSDEIDIEPELLIEIANDWIEDFDFIAE